MRILHISSVPIEYPGGTEKVIRKLAELQAKNNEVAVLQTDLYVPSKNPGKTKIGKVEVITCRNSFWLGGYGYSADFKEKLKNICGKFDLVHVHGHGRFTSDYAMSFLKNKNPLIYTAHGFFHTKKYGFFKRMHDLVFGSLVKNARFCTALTKLDYTSYKKLGVSAGNIIEIPNGADIERIQRAKKADISYFKKKYADGKKMLLYAGRIHESKGLQYVMPAIKDIDCELVIAGEDAGYKNRLLKMAEQLEIKEKVIFTGRLGEKELFAAYNAADALVLFSEWEGFGITAIEAMAAGCPIIASDRGALPFLVQNNKNGFIARWPNVGELNLKIKKALVKSRRMEKYCKRFAKRYDWTEINKEYEKLYEKAIQK